MTPTRNNFWRLLIPIVFAIGSARVVVASFFDPDVIGSHAALYTQAAAAWLTGADPWSVGTWPVQFAGPPPMLLPFVPFVALPEIVTRGAWVAIDLAVAAWSFRQLRIPGYWLGFPPLFEAIVLGHPELLVLGALVLAGSEGARRYSVLGGFAAVIKPYAALPLVAERRWVALAFALAVLVVTVPVLPWSAFLGQMPHITGVLLSQNAGDSTFGEPVLTALGVAALVALGERRALWLAVPVLWPAAQPLYKTMTVPMLSPLTAVVWALPIPGMTLAGVVAAAFLTIVERRQGLPAWLAAGITPIGTLSAPEPRQALVRFGWGRA